jgi:hypothetical protein
MLGDDTGTSTVCTVCVEMLGGIGTLVRVGTRTEAGTSAGRMTEVLEKPERFRAWKSVV